MGNTGNMRSTREHEGLGGYVEHGEYLGQQHRVSLVCIEENSPDWTNSHFGRFVFAVTALLPLITSLVAGLVKEERRDSASSALRDREAAADLPQAYGFFEISKSQLSCLWGTVKEPNIFMPTIFIFLWQATPTSDTAMFFFTYGATHPSHSFNCLNLESELYTSPMILC